MKKCTQCGQTKDPAKDFYVCSGRSRPECKKCTNRKNVAYQKKNKEWLARDVDPEKKREYSRAYYHKNKDKHAAYRKQFNDSHRWYYREYLQKKKNEPFIEKDSSRP